MVKVPILYHRAHFLDDRSNRCKIFSIFNIAAIAILHLKKFEILTVGPLSKASVRLTAKFSQNR